MRYNKPQINHTRENVIEILDQFSFFLSDNGDTKMTGKDYMDMYYPLSKHPVITEKWFKDTFESITEDIMNGETAQDIIFNLEDDVWIINFSTDCGRAGFFTDNKVKIYNKDSISVDMSETPLEGGGIEDELEEEIKKLLNE